MSSEQVGGSLTINANTRVGALLGMSGLACLVIGLAALVAPTTTANRIGYSFVTPGGRGEFMTFYGGFYAGIGLFLLLAMRIQLLRPGAVVFLALSATAAIPIRVYTLVQIDNAAPIFTPLLAGEILFALAGWLGWYWIDVTDEKVKTTEGEGA